MTQRQPMAHRPPTLRHTSRKIREPYPIGYGRRQLTDRQRQVARMIGERKQQTEIARELQMSEGSVHMEIKACLHKLYLYNTQALGDWARMYPELLMT